MDNFFFFLFSCKGLFIYLQGRDTERGRDLPSVTSLPKWLQWSVGPVQDQVPGASLSSPLWMQGPQNLGHLSPVTQAYEQGAGLEVKRLGCKSVPLWDAGAAGSTGHNSCLLRMSQDAGCIWHSCSGSCWLGFLLVLYSKHVMSICLDSTAMPAQHEVSLHITSLFPKAFPCLKLLPWQA